MKKKTESLKFHKYLRFIQENVENAVVQQFLKVFEKNRQNFVTEDETMKHRDINFVISEW